MPVRSVPANAHSIRAVGGDDSPRRGGRLTYASARDSLAAHLLHDAAAQDAERYDEVGRRFDAMEHEFPFGTLVELTRLHIALTFWDGWIDARNLGWQSSGNIRKSEWSLLARLVAADLTADRDITDPRVCERFDASTGRLLGDRVQSLTDRLRNR